MSETITFGGREWVVIPHSPDWGGGVRATRRWVGSDAAALDGTEVRLGLMPRPFTRLQFDLVAQTHGEGTRLLTRVEKATWLGRAAVPLWGRGERITAPASGTTINVADVALWGWGAGILVFIRLTTDPEHWDMVLIDSVVGSTELVLATALSRTYPTGTLIYPVLLGLAQFGDAQHLSDHHPAITVDVEAIKQGAGIGDDFGDGNGTTENWEDPGGAFTVEGESTGDETVDISGEFPVMNEDGEIEIRVKGGTGPYSVTSALGTQTGWLTTWPNLGQGIYCFDVTDSAGNEEEICVRVYREAYEFEFTNPYFFQFTNNHPVAVAQVKALHYGSSPNEFTWPVTYDTGEANTFTVGQSGLFRYGPEGSWTNNIGVNGLGVVSPGAPLFLASGQTPLTDGGVSVVPWRAVLNSDGTVTWTPGAWTDTFPRE